MSIDTVCDIFMRMCQPHTPYMYLLFWTNTQSHYTHPFDFTLSNLPKQTDATSASPSSMRSVPSAAPRRPMRTATGAAPGEEETPTPSAPP